MTSVHVVTAGNLDEVADRHAALREQGRVVRVLFPGFPMPVWVITGYEDVKQSLRDPRLVVDQSKVRGTEGPSMLDQVIAASAVAPAYRDFLISMVFMDGDVHLRLRHLVAPAFSVRRVHALRKRIERRIDELLAHVLDRDEVDLISEFCVPLATTVVCELVGIDGDDQPRVRDWIDDQAAEDLEMRRASIVGLVEHARELVARRRAQPAEDLISDLIAAERDNGDRLSDSEIIAIVILVINAGLHTTSNFIANSTLMLLDHPDELALLRANPHMLPHAVYELLRLATVVPVSTPMYATEDFEFGGERIRRGDVVIASFVAANHDPEAFPEPAKFDLTRPPEHAKSHMSFGYGPHYCLGATLARVEAELALERLLIKHDSISLAVPRHRLQYRPHPGGTLLVSLPVQLRTRNVQLWPISSTA